MNSNKTLSILQRLPVILAVTAASYGLAQPQATRTAPGRQAQQEAAQQTPALLQRR